MSLEKEDLTASGETNEQEQTEISTEEKDVVEAKTEPNDRENTARILNENKRVGEPVSDAAAKKTIAKHSRRGFLIGGAAAVFGFLGYSWLKKPDQSYIRRKRSRRFSRETRKFELFGNSRKIQTAVDKVSGRLRRHLKIRKPRKTGTRRKYEFRQSEIRSAKLYGATRH